MTMNIEGSNLQNKAFSSSTVITSSSRTNHCINTRHVKGQKLMTVVPTSSPEPIDNHEEPWTIECTTDNLTLCLAEVKKTINNNGKEIHVRKYYRQARELFKWIPIARPSPAFIIYISDLTSQIRTQIEQLITSPDNLRYVLTQAVGRIFENLDSDYYHLSIARSLRVRIEK